MRWIRNILVIGLISIWLMNLTGASLAQPPEVSEEANKKLAQDIGPLVKSVGMIDGTPGEINFHHWSGLALKDNESHVLRISIESGRPVNPTSVRKLLASNRTLDEVENEILPPGRKYNVSRSHQVGGVRLSAYQHHNDVHWEQLNP